MMLAWLHMSQCQQTLVDTSRHQQTLVDTRRHQQTLADTSRQQQTLVDTSRHQKTLVDTSKHQQTLTTMTTMTTETAILIDTQIVTWTAFAILAMFFVSVKLWFEKFSRFCGVKQCPNIDISGKIFKEPHHEGRQSPSQAHQIGFIEGPKRRNIKSTW